MKSFFQYLENPDSDKNVNDYWSRSSIADLKGAFAECLLFGDSVTIKLAYNSVTTLIDWLGLGLLEELLNENVIQFCSLEPVGTTYIISP